MQYALNTSTIRPTPLLEKIRVASKAGYAGIELWHDDIEAFTAQGGSIRDLRKALDDHGLKVPSTIYLAGWFDAREGELPRVLAHVERRMADAAALGAPYVIASPPAGKADYPLGAARYRRLMELGRTAGILPSMEFLGFVERLNTIEEAIKVLDLAADPAGTTILDPFHIFRGGGSVESISKLSASRIAVSHFNDTPAVPPRAQQGDADRVLPGDGHLDLTRYVQLLRQTGYDGWLSLELFNETLWARPPLEVARIGLEKMRAVVERA